MLELTGYQRTISNLLLQRALPTSTGFTHPVRERRRHAQPRRRGGAPGHPGRRTPVDWTTRGILTLNRSKITELPVEPASTSPTVGFGAGLGAFRIEEGKSATQIVSDIDGDGTRRRRRRRRAGLPRRLGERAQVSATSSLFGLLDWQQGSESST